MTLGYKVYFDGRNFHADDTPSEVRQLPEDAVVSWFADKYNAIQAVIIRNTYRQQDVKRCRDCHHFFWQSDQEREWYLLRGLDIPCRCGRCREYRHRYKFRMEVI